jgi:hypothetical protein
MKARKIPTSQLNRDIKHIKDHLNRWSGLYDAEALARTHRLLVYMQELKRYRNESVEESRV